MVDFFGEDVEVIEGYRGGYFRYWIDYYEIKGIYFRDVVKLIVRYFVCFVFLLKKEKNLIFNEIYLNVNFFYRFVDVYNL